MRSKENVQKQKKAAQKTESMKKCVTDRVMGYPGESLVAPSRAVVGLIKCKLTTFKEQKNFYSEREYSCLNVMYFQNDDPSRSYPFNSLPSELHYGIVSL